MATYSIQVRILMASNGTGNGAPDAVHMRRAHWPRCRSALRPNKQFAANIKRKEFPPKAAQAYLLTG